LPIKTNNTYSALIDINLGELNVGVDINKLDKLGTNDLAGSTPLSVEIDSSLKQPSQFLVGAVSHVYLFVMLMQASRLE
jgi:hypothetical protein